MPKLLDFFKGHPERWTKGCSVRDQETGESIYFPVTLKGDGVHLIEQFPEPEKCAFCLSGAITQFYGFVISPERTEAVEALKKELVPRGYGVIGFNDHPATKFEDIIKVLEAAQV